MNRDNSSADTQIGPATIAVHGGGRTKEAPLGAVVSPVSIPQISPSIVLRDAAMQVANCQTLISPCPWIALDPKGLTL